MSLGSEQDCWGPNPRGCGRHQGSPFHPVHTQPSLLGISLVKGISLGWGKGLIGPEDRLLPLGGVSTPIPANLLGLPLFCEHQWEVGPVSWEIEELRLISWKVI